MTREELEMRKLVRESDVIDRTDGSDLAKAFNHLWEKYIEQEHCEDIMTIHTQGLDEGIRCAMCTNSMKSDRGCDGGCVVNEAMYKEVMNTIRNHIVPPVTPARPKGKWINKSQKSDCGITFVASECTCCGKKTLFNCDELIYKYCPNCGSKMESE